MQRSLLASFATALIAQYASAISFNDDKLGFAQQQLPTPDQQDCLDYISEKYEKKYIKCENNAKCIEKADAWR